MTKVLGKLACLVLSKILGIGTAKRNWKQVKAIKSGQRVNTGMDKTNKQVLIYAHYQQMRAQASMSMRKLSVAGKLWEDADFDSMQMDPFCREIKDSLAAKETTEQPVRVLRLWQERWELKKLGPQGISILEALLEVVKRLQMDDTDNAV